MCRRQMLLCLLLLTPAAAPAGTRYLVQCEDGGFRTEVHEGTGTREQLLGIDSVALWCPSAGELRSERVGLPGEAFDNLRAIAARDAPDGDRIGAHLPWLDDDTPLGESTRSAIGWEGQGTFGQLRRRLAGLAQPAGYVEESGFRQYRAPSCPEPLVPLRYYLNTRAPFPGCGGGRLQRVGTEAATWD